ncbi:MAG: hypothetical protein RLZZ188_2838 [Verrucomicrobiota bacterium]
MIETLNGSHESKVAFLNKIQKPETGAFVASGHAHHQA